MLIEAKFTGDKGWVYVQVFNDYTGVTTYELPVVDKPDSDVYPHDENGAYHDVVTAVCSACRRVGAKVPANTATSQIAAFIMYNG